MFFLKSLFSSPDITIISDNNEYINITQKELYELKEYNKLYLNLQQIINNKKSRKFLLNIHADEENEDNKSFYINQNNNKTDNDIQNEENKNNNDELISNSDNDIDTPDKEEYYKNTSENISDNKEANQSSSTLTTISSNEIENENENEILIKTNENFNSIHLQPTNNNISPLIYNSFESTCETSSNINTKKLNMNNLNVKKINKILKIIYDKLIKRKKFVELMYNIDNIYEFLMFQYSEEKEEIEVDKQNIIEIADVKEDIVIEYFDNNIEKINKNLSKINSYISRLHIIVFCGICYIAAIQLDKA